MCSHGVDERYACTQCFAEAVFPPEICEAFSSGQMVLVDAEVEAKLEIAELNRIYSL